MNITMNAVDPERSTQIAKVGYDGQAQILAIEFKSGGLYHYRGVPENVYAGLMSAVSLGKFLNAEIKPHYKVSAIAKQDR